MPTADLYIRVSTDEQADKGFSQRYQEEVLKKYCESHNLTVQAVIFEDFSAKNFIRPAWCKLFASYKKNKSNRPTLLLFTKWDRFSRNTADAYNTIQALKKFCIQPIAIEQPLDTSVPENQMTLAFYLAIPEVENARRSLNIKQGLRRAKKEGRCTGLAPVGYTNKVTKEGVSYIVPSEPYATIMRIAFEQIAARTHNVTEAYLHAIDNGFQKSRSSFYRSIHNPIYGGMIYVHATDDESEQYAPGQHQPIVSETTFFKVQQILNKQHQRLPNKSNIEYLFPLRGFLKCMKCGNTQTASGSRGRSGKYYYYYHCHSHCQCHLRTDKLHSLFIKELKTFKLVAVYSPICLSMLNRILTDTSELKTTTVSHLTKKVYELNNKIEKARELLLHGDIDGADFKAIKTDSQSQITILCDLISTCQIKKSRFSDVAKSCLSLFSSLHQIYEEGNIHIKRKLISLIFPEYLVCNGTSFHTTNVTTPIKILYNKEFAFKGTFPYNCLTKKECSEHSDEPMAHAEDCNNLKEIARYQYYNMTTNEAVEIISFINTLSTIICEQKT